MSEHNQALIQGRYKIKRTLGEGAFATTYLCEDTQEGQDVAIKAMRLTQVDAWKSFELFEREARVLKSLDHPGVPDFYDVFRVEDDEQPNAFYLVQEYIEGRSLQDMLDAGDRLTSPELMQLTLGLLDILHALHTMSPPVYHRDIKPSNIIIKPMGAPVLIDFGSVCDGWREQDAQGSTVAGTHGYMPPEQYMGKVSAGSDLYALAATLLHVITGQAPSAFSFDTGRIELPDNLPCVPEIQEMINQSLETALNARPNSAKDARDIIINKTQNAPQTAMVRHHPTTAIASSTHPKLATIGPPPRDPNGPERDYYQMMVPGIFSTNIAQTFSPAGSSTNQSSVAGLFLFLFLSVCLAGFWIPIWAVMRSNRKHKYGPLFIRGVYVEGIVLGVNAIGGNNTVGSSVVFSFEVDGVSYRNGTQFSGTGIYFAPNDPIGVLYLPEDPQRSVAIFK